MNIKNFFKASLLLFLLACYRPAWALSCFPNSISDSLYFSASPMIIAFTVTAKDENETYWDVKITHILVGDEIGLQLKGLDEIFRIQQGTGLQPRYSFDVGSTWVASLLMSGSKFYIYTCVAPIRTINGATTERTGITWLDNRKKSASIEELGVALNSYLQGIASADKVCKSSAVTYCDGTRPKYDAKTGLLSLPTIQHDVLIYPAYAKAIMQKINDNPMLFRVEEVK